MKKLLITIAFLCLPLFASAADTLTFGNATNGATCAPCSSITFALDVGASSSRFLTGSFKTAGDEIISVEYAGVSSTLIDEQNSTGGLGGYVSFYGHLAPTTGSNNVVATAAGSISFMAGTAESYWNVDQNFPTIKAKGVCDSTTACNASGTTVVDGSWIVAGFGNQVGSCSAGSGTNLRGDNGVFAACSGDSGIVSPAGTDNVNMTIAAGGNWGWVNIVLKPSGVVAASAFCITPGICQ